MSSAVLRRPLAVLLAILGIALLAACGSDSSPASTPTSTTVVDVRTPAEFASGHVEGAVNIDVEGAGFDAAVAALPKDASYLVYCRSGRRSALAAERMRAAGLSVTDGGGLDAMKASGRRFTS